MLNLLKKIAQKKCKCYKKSMPIDNNSFKFEAIKRMYKKNYIVENYAYIWIRWKLYQNDRYTDDN